MWSQAGLSRKDFDYLWDYIDGSNRWFYKLYDSDWSGQVSNWFLVGFNQRLFEELDNLFEYYLEKVAKK